MINLKKCVSRLARCKSHHTRPPPPIPTAPPSLAAKFFFLGEICIGMCPKFSFFARCDVIGFWGSPLGRSSSKWEKTCYASMPVIMPDFIAVGQTV